MLFVFFPYHYTSFTFISSWFIIFLPYLETKRWNDPTADEEPSRGACQSLGECPRLTSVMKFGIPSFTLVKRRFKSNGQLKLHF